MFLFVFYLKNFIPLRNLKSIYEKIFYPLPAKFNLKLTLMAFVLFLFVNSCKKELYNGEKIDPARQKEMLAYKNGPKVEIIDLAQFKSKVNINASGTLKEEFVVASASKSKVMSIHTAETYLGFKIITDSIKVIKAKGHTMYIFPVVLPSKKAISFQNLTIDESATGTVAFVNTYTPTKKWIEAWKKGHPGKFEGEVSVKYLKLNNGSKSPIQKTIAVAQICTTTTYYFEVPYNCASGEHAPGDSGCTLVGGEMAGYALYEALVTECVDDPNTPPPPYNPCPGAPPAVSGKKSFGNKIMVAPPTNCDSVERDPLDTDEFRAMEADYRSHMKPAELAIYDAMPFGSRLNYLQAAQSAISEAESRFPGNQEDTKADAFRHALFNILNVLWLGNSTAESLGFAHETKLSNGQYSLASTVDLYNNAAGRAAFVWLPAGAGPREFYSNIVYGLVTNGSLVYLKNGIITPTNQ